jgi:hypothetical protein
VRGELVRPIAVVPPVSIALPENALVLPNGGTRNDGSSGALACGAAERGSLMLSAADGWRVEPERSEFTLEAGEQKVLSFMLRLRAANRAPG